MTIAILEILALLTVSCLIGIFFTYHFWKSKYFQLLIKNGQLTKEANHLIGEVHSAESKREQEEKNLKPALDHERMVVENISKDSTKQYGESKANETEVKKYKEEIVLLKAEMDEMERELEAVSEELDLRKISYYRHIDGKRYKAATLNMADEAIEGRGDGRISMEEAEMIFDTISNGTDYTQVEKHTVKYLRDHYNWTDKADELFRTKVRSWAASDHELV